VLQYEDSVLFSEDPPVGLALCHMNASYYYNYITRHPV